MDSTTLIAPPLDASTARSLHWDDEADVIVVGWGAAGACAAIEARAAGATVLVLDRFNGGGASALSGGVVYAGGGTRQQLQAGVLDTPAAMADYLQLEVQGVVSAATVERFCNESASQLEWLEAQGARFGATLPAHKTSYPPDGVFLYHSGNEMVPAYRGAEAPAPRGHRAVAKGQSGAALFAALRAATLRSGARTLMQAAVRRLVREGDRIIGVEVWCLCGEPAQAHARLTRRIERWRLLRPGRCQQWREQAAAIERAHAVPRLLRARRGLVLATGGFVFNRELMQTHAPQALPGFPIGTAGCDGSGLRLGQSAGGTSEQLGNVSCWRFISPPYAWPQGAVVNSRGARFCDEAVYGAKLGHEIVVKQGGRAWLILDANLRSQSIRECLVGRLWGFQSVPALIAILTAKKAQDLAQLAARIGADTAALAHSAEEKSLSPRGPFYAIDISIGQPAMPMATITLGGLRVNEADGHVVDASGCDIAGLFAAGRCAIGLASSHYVSGLSLADCVFSGRRAGRAAAA